MGGIRLGGLFAPTPIVPYIRQDGTDEFEGPVSESIYYVPLAGGNAGANAVRATFPVDPNFHTMPSVSPNYSMISYMQNYADLRIVEIPSLNTYFNINMDSGGIFGNNARQRWKPDSTKIVYSNPNFSPSRTRLYVIDVAEGAPNRVQLREWTPAVSIGDFGYSYDGSVIAFRDPVLETLCTIEDDGTNFTNTGLSIDPTNVNAYKNRLTPGKVSDLVVYLDQTAAQIRKCQLDGSGDTLVYQIGANEYRFSNHILSDDDSTVVFMYDTLNWATPDGWFTSSIGKDSQVISVDVATGNATSTNVWAYMETIDGNLSNNGTDVPYAYGDRFYVAYNNIANGGTWPGGDVHDYFFGSALLDGSGRRIEDDFDMSGPFPEADWEAPWTRITMEGDPTA